MSPLSSDPAEVPTGISKAQGAYLWIKEKIASGEYTPGYRLVLASIASKLDMSVVPVREAIRRLEAEGFVTFERNVGASVSMVDESQYRVTMEALGVLEGAATSLGSRYLSEKDLAQARSINREMEACLINLDPATFTQKNQEFHKILYSKCPNHRLRDLADTEWEKLNHIRTSTFSFVPHRAKDSVEEHYRILDLIEARAPEPSIEEAVRAHRSATLDTYLTNHWKTHR